MGFGFYLPWSRRHNLPRNFESYEEGLFLRQLDKQLFFLQRSHHALTPQSSHYPSTNSYLPILIFTRINLSISPHRPAAYQLSQPVSNDIIDEMVMTLYNTQRVPLLILVVTLLEAEHLTALQMCCDSGKLHKNRLAWGERHSVHDLVLKVICCIVYSEDNLRIL